MTKQEIQTIENIIARLKKMDCGACSRIPTGLRDAEETNEAIKLMHDRQFEVVPRIYLDTWIIGALECLLPGEGHDPKLAADLSK